MSKTEFVTTQCAHKEYKDYDNDKEISKQKQIPFTMHLLNLIPLLLRLSTISSTYMYVPGVAKVFTLLIIIRDFKHVPLTKSIWMFLYYVAQSNLVRFSIFHFLLSKSKGAIATISPVLTPSLCTCTY